MKQSIKLWVLSWLVVPVIALAAEPFSVRLTGNTLEVFSGARRVVSWTDYKSHEFFGDYIALTDTKGVFGVYGSDGRVIVNNYTKLKQYWLTPQFVAVWDTDGVFDVYSVATGKAITPTWRNTVRAYVDWETIVLVDNVGILDAYNANGSVIVRNYTKTKDFSVRGDYVAILDSSGDFDAYRRNGERFIRAWKDATKYIARNRYIAIVDRFGVLQAYRVSDGFELLRQNGVTDIKEGRQGVHYLQNGEWKFFPIR